MHFLLIPVMLFSIILIRVSYFFFWFSLSSCSGNVPLQGLPGEKGQKGDLGQPQLDIFQTVKVFFDYILLFSFKPRLIYNSY